MTLSEAALHDKYFYLSNLTTFLLIAYSALLLKKNMKCRSFTREG